MDTMIDERCASSAQSCGGKPDPAGVCAVRGCTAGDMERCAAQHGSSASSKPESRWHIPPRPARDEFPPPPARLHRRWDRTARLLGDDAMSRLASSHVVVFGMGGVGSYAVEGLARSGVGRLTLVDFDDVCITNFNRQLHAVRGTVGKPKAVLMAERVEAINPDAWVEPIQAFYEASTSDALLEPRPDFVVDCIDNVTAKLHLLATCHQRGIPVVSSMGAAARLDPTRVRVADLSETHSDPLAKAIRKNLRLRYGIDCNQPVGITAVFSEESVNLPEELAYDSIGFLCVCPHRADSPHSCEKRSIIHGTAVFVTSVFGMTAAGVAVRALSGKR
jgi:tRNA A37 threonylcarbamoyladenosine dehydratase